jgi:hypothetical protein
MNKLLSLLCAGVCLFSTSLVSAQSRFGESLCTSADYTCHKVLPGESWESLFPDILQADMVKRVNRMNISLKPGIIIAIPNNLDTITLYDVSPFPRYITPEGEKTIFVDQKKLAWGAYDAEGQLIWWGPISSGSGHCNKIDGNCLTPTGSFRVVRKQDYDCISTVFPRHADGTMGGAEMPYCIHFWRGFALHGSEEVPGYRASHGCVRMFIEDAQWLNQEFVELPGAGGFKGTKVVIE